MSDKSSAAYHPGEGPKPFWLIVPLNAEPWAVGPITTGRRGGKIFANMGRNQQLAYFQQAVRESIGAQWGGLPLLEGAKSLTVFFWRQRQDYRTESERRHRKHEADATNLLKGFEDALQGVLFKNDRDNVSVTSHIMEQSADLPNPLIVVRLQVIPNLDVYRRRLLDDIPEGTRYQIGRALTAEVDPVSDNSWGPEQAGF